MDEKKKREEKQKLKALRKELEEKIKGIIPDALKTQVISEEDHERIEALAEIDEQMAKHIVESLLLATSKPISEKDISRIIKKYSPAQVRKIIEELKTEYVAQDHGFRIVEIAGGHEISTLPHLGMWIAKLEKEKKAKHASIAALETLAILAYRQPITRVEIEEIRGVDASGVIMTLLDRGFIKILGRKEVAGRPLIYGTTDTFLEHFGLRSIEDLPDIEEIKTLVENTIQKEELLRKENIVTAPDEDVEKCEEGKKEREEAVASIADKYDEISEQIATIEVMSKKKVDKIINPEPEVPVAAEGEAAEASDEKQELREEAMKAEDEKYKEAEPKEETEAQEGVGGVE